MDINDLMNKIATGVIPHDAIIEFEGDSFLALDLCMCKSDLNNLEKHQDYFKKNNKMPFVEKYLFFLNKDFSWYNRGADGKDKLKFFLDCGVNPNSVYTVDHFGKKVRFFNFDFLGDTPLMHSQAGICTNLLMEYGADIHKKSQKGEIISSLFQNPFIDDYFEKIAKNKKNITFLEFKNSSAISPEEYNNLKYFFDIGSWTQEKYWEDIGLKEIAKKYNQKDFNLSPFELCEKKKQVAKLNDFKKFSKNSSQTLDEKDVIAYQEIKDNLSNPKVAYKLFTNAMQINNLYVLDKITEFEELIKNNKSDGKNCLFLAIDSSRLNWIEKIWALDYLPHNAVNSFGRSYIGQSLARNKKKILDFLIKNTDFTLFDEKTIEYLQNDSVRHPTKYSSFFINLNNYIESKNLKQNTSNSNKKKIGVL